MKKLFLASKSPRRNEILKNAGFQFEIVNSDYEEELDSKVFSYERIETLAKNKALGAINNISEPAIIIGADTVVVYDNKILTKPKDYDDAFNTLKLLSNKTHLVVTSICVLDSETKQFVIDSTTTKVEFDILSDKMIHDYITEYKPFDKAGAYGIQEMPAGYIKSVDGDLENVIGISSESVRKTLKRVKDASQ